MNLTSTIRDGEHSHRSLIHELMTLLAVDITRKGILKHIEGSDSKRMALDTYAVLNALDWLRNLDPALCPDIVEPTFDDLLAAAEADKAENPEFYDKFNDNAKEPK